MKIIEHNFTKTVWREDVILRRKTTTKLPIMYRNRKAKVLSELQPLQEDGEDLGKELQEVLPIMERRSVSVRKTSRLLGGSCVD